MSDVPASPAARLAVRKTYKLYIGGAFPRSESGRSYPVTDHKDGFLANAALASRKDARDAVAAARKALAGWAGATAYNRGQVLYRVAELLEGRRAQFTAEVRAAEGLGARAAEAVVDAADRPLGLVRRLGGQDHAGARRGESGRRALLQLLAARAHRCRRGARPAGLEPARPRLRRRARCGQRQHRGRAGQRVPPAARRHAVGSARHLRCPRRGDQRPDRPDQRRSLPGSRPTWTSTPST